MNKKIEKYPSVWKLSNTCVDNPFPKDEITIKIENILNEITPHTLMFLGYS